MNQKFGFIQISTSYEITFNVVSTVDRVSQGWAEGGSGQQIDGGIKSIVDMIVFAPIGVFTALFRPLLGEVNNIFGILAGLENTLLLIIIMYFTKELEINKKT
ncbi:hypothetical protein [Zooshikella ganghwensis]|nr:hypothetical protein [Zooshikella ganghwensis]